MEMVLQRYADDTSGIISHATDTTEGQREERPKTVRPGPTATWTTQGGSHDHALMPEGKEEQDDVVALQDVEKFFQMAGNALNAKQSVAESAIRYGLDVRDMCAVCDGEEMVLMGCGSEQGRL